MRIKKRFLFDEEVEAQRIVEEGFPNGLIDYGEIYIVAKYFREKYELGAIRLEKMLLDFCLEQDETFNPVINQETIKKWVNSAMNYNLRKVKEIWLSEAEVGFLKTIENNRDRKLLFMTLVFSKALKNANTRREKPAYKKSNNYYIRYNNLKDVIRMSELTNISEVRFSKILHKYKDYFTFYTPEKELIKLEFTDKSERKDIVVQNLDNPLEAYQEIFGKNMTYCEVCGNEIYKRSRNQKYCNHCAKEVRRIQKREEMRNRRKN